MKIKIGLVDDHQLFLKSLELMLATFTNCEVVIEAFNGEDLQEKLALQPSILPDIILLDVAMPIMNGIETAKWLSTNHPSIKLIALSMNDNDKSIIAMIKAGCCAYLLKDSHPTVLETALIEVAQKGYYNGDLSNIDYKKILVSQYTEDEICLSEKEKNFLQEACSDLTYKQIAVIMNISERSVDNLREVLFQKLNVKSRVGMALEAVRKNLVTL